MKSYRASALRLSLMLAALCVGAAVLTACGSTGTAGSSSSTSTSTSSTTSGSEPQKGGEISVSLSQPAATLDPSLGVGLGEAMVNHAIYSSLMEAIKPGEEPHPYIAESMTESQDGMTWTMKLPTGLTFSDGTPFNAEAVVYNLKRDMGPKSSIAALLSSVKSVSSPDPTTVLIHMKEPFTSLPYAFAYENTAGFIASPTALKKYGEEYSEHASGLGPFMVQSWSSSGKVVLVKNPHYWNEAKEPVYLDKVTVLANPNDQSSYQSVQAGDLTLMGTRFSSILAAAEGNEAVKTVMGDTENNIEGIMLNLAEAPFDNLEVRKAMSMAINREELAALTTNELGGPAVNLFGKGSPYSDSYAQPEYDLAGAKKIVAAYKEKTGHAPSFSYTCGPEQPSTEVIVHQLQEAGFDVKVKTKEDTALFSDFIESKYQAICWALAPFRSPDFLPYRFFYSKGELNTGGYDSAAFDSAANAARAATDPAVAKAEWQKADKALTEELPWVFTTTGPIGFVMSPKLNGIEYEEPYRMWYFVPSFEHAWLEK